MSGPESSTSLSVMFSHLAQKSKMIMLYYVTILYMQFIAIDDND